VTPELPRLLDWRQLTGIGVFVAGATLIVATWSYHHWRALESGERFFAHIRSPAPAKLLAVGLMLLSVGLTIQRGGGATQRVLGWSGVVVSSVHLARSFRLRAWW
jgi:hypothetical protein